MKKKSLAIILSCLLLLSCLSGCSTTTEESTDSLTSSDIDVNVPTDDALEDSIITTQKVTTTTSQSAEQMVWIPSTGSKYHRSSSCSNMKNPSKVTVSYAKSHGFTPCKKCYG